MLDPVIDLSLDQSFRFAFWQPASSEDAGIKQRAHFGVDFHLLGEYAGEVSQMAWQPRRGFLLEEICRLFTTYYFLPTTY